MKMLTPQQIEERRRGIGGSDVAAICGLSRYKTAADVWREKTSRDIPILNPEQADILERGHELEPFVRTLFEQKTGKKVALHPESLTHPTIPFLKAHIDGFIGEEKAIVEFKTCHFVRSGEFGDDLSDTIPNDYLFQVHHYLSVTNMNKAYVAVLFGNDKSVFPTLRAMVKDLGIEKTLALSKGLEMRIFIVERNARLEKILEKKLTHFWGEHVEKNIVPPAQTRDDVLRAFPVIETGSRAPYDDEALDLALIIEKTRKEEKELEEQREKAEIRLQSKLGGCEQMMAPDNTILCRWSVYERTRVDTKVLKAIHKDIYGEVTRVTTVRRFIV
jgi:putative phage-type endonuclease